MSELCSAGILGTGHYAPEKILSNADLERMVDTSDEWIRTRTGIETRHIASRSETTSDLCVINPDHPGHRRAKLLFRHWKWLVLPQTISTTSL